MIAVWRSATASERAMRELRLVTGILPFVGPAGCPVLNILIVEESPHPEPIALPIVMRQHRTGHHAQEWRDARIGSQRLGPHQTSTASSYTSEVGWPAFS